MVAPEEEEFVSSNGNSADTFTTSSRRPSSSVTLKVSVRLRVTSRESNSRVRIPNAETFRGKLRRSPRRTGSCRRHPNDYAVGAQSIAGERNSAPIDRQALLVGHRALNGGSGLRRHSAANKHKTRGIAPRMLAVACADKRMQCWQSIVRLIERSCEPPTQVDSKVRMQHLLRSTMKRYCCGYCRSGKYRCQAFYTATMVAIHANNKCCECLYFTMVQPQRY